MTDSIAALGASQPNWQAAEPKPKNAGEAATQFEALLIAQMLRMAHESSEGALGGEKDPTGDTMWDMAAQQFSQLMAANGGIGLAKLIKERL